MAREKLVQILAITLVFAAVGYVWAVYVYAPLDESERRARLSISQLEHDVRQLHAFADAFQDLSQREASLLSDLRARLLPYHQVDPPDLVHQLLQDIDRCGMQVTSCAPTTNARKKFYVRDNVDVRLTGSFAQIMSFLQMVGGHSLLVTFKKGAMAKGGRALTFDASAAFYSMEAEK